MADSSDITKEQFALIEGVFPKKTTTRPALWSKHQIINAIFYQLKNGCKWEDLPKDLPPKGTVFHYFNTWKKTCLWEEMLNSLWETSRVSHKKK
jgi:transposase